MSNEHKEHEHKEHHSAHEHSGSHSKQEKILGFDLKVVVLVFALVIMAALAGTWFGAMSAASAASATSAGVNIDKAALKISIEDYFNQNKLAIFGSDAISLKVANIKDANDGLVLVDYTITAGTDSQAGTFFASATRVYVAQMVLDLTTNLPKPTVTAQTQAEPVKSDKPVAELHVFSYCPAGTAALESFAQTADALKSVADVKVKFFSDMHGAHELQQNKIQECIQTIAKDKYWTYAGKFVTDIYPVCGSSRSVECDLNESVKLMNSLGIDSTAVINCVKTQGDALYAADQADAQALKLQYSPSVVVNGVYFGNADRSPEGLKNLICDSFNTVPSVCSVALGSATATSTGSC